MAQSLASFARQGPKAWPLMHAWHGSKPGSYVHGSIFPFSFIFFIFVSLFNSLSK
jgi:hypothetical protein